MTDGSVLFVEPDAESRDSVAAELRQAGFDIQPVASAETAERALENTVFDCLITEYELPETNGLELVESVRETFPDIACIIFTGTSFESIETATVGTAVAEFQRKDDPNAVAALTAWVERCVTAKSQSAYPLPDDESDRLATIDGYAQNVEQAESTLEVITHLGANVFDLPMAAIGLMADHEQRFPVCYGAAFDPLTREDTICTWAMLDDDVTVIEDVQADPRFSENKAVASMGIRSYASANLRGADGTTIGTFCVYGHEPRTFSPREREVLASLADLAAQVLELAGDRHHASEGDA